MNESIEWLVWRIRRFYHEHFALTIVVTAILAVAVIVFGGVVLSPGLGNT